MGRRERFGTCRRELYLFTEREAVSVVADDIGNNRNGLKSFIKGKNFLGRRNTAGNIIMHGVMPDIREKDAQDTVRKCELNVRS